MALFMDYHEDLKLPAEAPAQIAEDTSHARADRFGVRQVEPCHNPDGKVYCLLDGPDQDAIRQHHTALGVPCGEVHPGRQPHPARTNRTIAARERQ
jgi:Nickel responsive protein SCO4226-like